MMRPVLPRYGSPLRDSLTGCIFSFFRDSLHDAVVDLGVAMVVEDAGVAFCRGCSEREQTPLQIVSSGEDCYHHEENLVSRAFQSIPRLISAVRLAVMGRDSHSQRRSRGVVSVCQKPNSDSNPECMNSFLCCVGSHALKFGISFFGSRGRSLHIQ